MTISTNDDMPTAEILSVGEYEKIANAFNLLRLLISAEKDIKNSRYKEARAFFKEFKRAK